MNTPTLTPYQWAIVETALRNHAANLDAIAANAMAGHAVSAASNAADLRTIADSIRQTISPTRRTPNRIPRAKVAA
jgi:hypothetical protein